jgi:mRNA (guanine-N7-)-methyltransferase
MPPLAASEQPASNITPARQPVKRKRDRPSAASSKTTTPNAYARRSPPRERARPKEDSDSERDQSRSPPRKLKRPGAGARINPADRSAAEAARKQREEEDRKRIQERNAAEVVAEHYNAVPERGREWRKTDSQIKGLRSLNNWIKSTLIQKFSRPENFVPGQHLLVLDMACGKGGDLGKWEKAPVVPSLYLGCDIADVSIEQARSRWNETLRKNRNRRGPPPMTAEFYVQDSFGQSLANIPTVRQVGFNPNAGPAGGIIQPGMMSGNFDVVSMMFALHYSYENQELAKGMLRNVAGALKKGGKFIGVMPNSDVISATVKKLLQAESKGQTPNGKAHAADVKDEKSGSEDGEVEEQNNWDPEKPSDAGTTDDDDWDPEKPSEPGPATSNGTAEDDEDDWDPEKPSESTTSAQPVPNSATPAQPSTSPASTLPPLEWGNSIYTVRFPRSQPLTNLPLPKDGIFRPPYGWRYHYQLEEAVDVPEYVVPWEAFRALAEEYGLELMYRKGFKDVLDEIWGESVDEGEAREAKELAMLAERMGVLSRDRSQGKGGLLVGDEEMEAAAFYHAFCFYKT